MKIPMTPTSLIKIFSAMSIACLVTTLDTSDLSAQKFAPYKSRNHELIRGDMPPGVAADLTRMSNPKLTGHVQPVRVIGPIGSRIEVNTGAGYTVTNSSRVSVGLQIGPVYRFKVTNIPNHAGKELYPTVEVLGKLNPPKGLENEFPVQVLIAQDDLEEVLKGRMVTKVVYLEDPRMSLPHKHGQDKQPFFDVGAAQDPLKTARTMGRPMAILRIGSRIPLATEQAQGFGFAGSSAEILPNPTGAMVRNNTDQASPSDTPIPNSQVGPGSISPIPTGSR